MKRIVVEAVVIVVVWAGILWLLIFHPCTMAEWLAPFASNRMCSSPR